jgi:hypothetical protein
MAGWFLYLNLRALRTGAPASIPAPQRVEPHLRAREPRLAPPPAVAPPARPAPDPTEPAGSVAPAATSAWVPPLPPPPSFDDEIGAAGSLLDGGQPELAAIAVGRARRLAGSPDEHATVDRFEAEIARQVAGRAR